MSVALLAAVLGFALVRPRRWPEAAAAVPAAVIAVAAGAVSVPDAWAETRRLLPVAGFLAAVLVLADLCDDEGLFAAAGAVLAAGCGGRPTRLLAGVFAVAALTTAVLSLDATVVLLTPVVFATAARAGMRAKPYVYACTHLANSASLLLPVSNLTNLLALAASGLSFLRFAALMALPWLAAITVEFLVFRRFFAADLAAAAETDQAGQAGERPGVPAFTLLVVGLTLAGFAVASLAGANPAWAALAGVLLLAARARRQRRTTLPALLAAASPLFLLFVLALGVLVRAVVDNGLGTAVDRLLPAGSTLPRPPPRSTRRRLRGRTARRRHPPTRPSRHPTRTPRPPRTRSRPSRRRRRLAHPRPRRRPQPTRPTQPRPGHPLRRRPRTLPHPARLAPTPTRHPHPPAAATPPTLTDSPTRAGHSRNRPAQPGPNPSPTPRPPAPPPTGSPPSPHRNRRSRRLPSHFGSTARPHDREATPRRPHGQDQPPGPGSARRREPGPPIRPATTCGATRTAQPGLPRHLPTTNSDRQQQPRREQHASSRRRKRSVDHGFGGGRKGRAFFLWLRAGNDGVDARPVEDWL